MWSWCRRGDRRLSDRSAILVHVWCDALAVAVGQQLLGQDAVHHWHARGRDVHARACVEVVCGPYSQHAVPASSCKEIRR